MVDQRDSLAREVDEELRREQLLKLWAQYGNYVIAAVLLIIVGVGGYKYLEHRRQVAAETAGGRFVEATKDAAQNRAAEAQKALQGIAATGPAGYATLARLRLAAADLAAGKTAEAATGYEAVAKERGADPMLVDFARLQAAMLRLETASWTDMQNRLNPLAADGNPWRFSARELLGLAAYKAGKTEEARQELQRLVGDRNTPPGIAERARLMMAMLTESELARITSSPSDKPEANDDKAQAKTDGKAKAKASDKKSK